MKSYCSKCGVKWVKMRKTWMWTARCDDDSMFMNNERVDEMKMCGDAFMNIVVTWMVFASLFRKLLARLGVHNEMLPNSRCFHFCIIVCRPVLNLSSAPPAALTSSIKNLYRGHIARPSNLCFIWVYWIQWWTTYDIERFKWPRGSRHSNT